MFTIMDTPPAGTLEALDAQWLDAQGRLRLLPAEAFLSVDPWHFKAWCCERARYVVPTVELIEFLKERIGNRKAIEIAAGNADLGHLLGIPMTDSRVQQLEPAVAAYLTNQKQARTNPPKAVLTMDANTAVQRFHPEVVVGAWLTRKFRVGVDGPAADAFMYGADDERIIGRVKMYIHIGADHVHGTKTALSLPHEVVRLPGLISRVSDQSSNVIYIWGK